MDKTQVINIPGVGEFTFPADMSDAEIDAALQRELNPASPAKPPVNALDETEAILDKGIRGGLAAGPGLMDLGVLGIQKPLQWGMELASGAPFNSMAQAPDPSLNIDAPGPEAATPLTGFGQAFLDATGGELSQPQTTGGKYAGEALQGLIGAFAGPGGFTQPFRNAAIGTMSGLGGEAGAQLTGGGDSPIARLAGALLAGGGTALGTSFIPNWRTLTKDATRFVTDEDFAKAAARQQLYRDQGIPEIASQFLGPRSTLADVMGQVSENQFTRPRLFTHMAELPNKVKGLIESFMERTFPLSPMMAEENLQLIKEKAVDKLSGVRQGGNAAYEKALAPGVNNRFYMDDEIANLRGMLRETLEDPSYFGEHTPQGRDLKNFMETNLGQVDDTGKVVTGEELLRNWRYKGEVNNLYKGLNKMFTEADYSNAQRRKLLDVLDEFTANDYGAARDAKSAYMQNTYNPMSRGPVGQIARAGGELDPEKLTAAESMFKILLDSGKDKSAYIQSVSKELGPESVAGITREYLTKKINEGFKHVPTEKAFNQPYSVRQMIAGTPTQEKNLETALETMASAYGKDGQLIKNQFKDIIQVMDDNQHLKISQRIDKTSVEQTAGSNALSKIVAPQSRAARWMHDMVMKDAYGKLVDMVTNPEGLKIIEGIAKSKDPQATQVFVRSLYSTSEDNFKRNLE